jgi:hypothetical protein
MARSSLRGYYTAEKSTRGQDVSYQAIRFHIPKRVGKAKRREIIEAVLEESGADALIEVMVSKEGGLMRKEMWNFDAILIFDKPGKHTKRV